MVIAALLTLAPVCVLGKVVIEPGMMNKVIVNIADDRTKKLVTKMPPSPDGGFMMFLDPGVYRMRLVSGLRGKPVGLMRVFTVEADKPKRICIPSKAVAKGLGRLEGFVSSKSSSQAPVPPLGMFKNCTVMATGADGKTIKLSAKTHGIFTADLKPGDYTLTTDFKSKSPMEPLKITIKDGQLTSATLNVESGT